MIRTGRDGAAARSCVPLGFERSYPTLTRELRRLGLRPVCEVCRRGGHRLDGRARARAGRGAAAGLARAARRRRGVSRRTCWSARCRTRAGSAACSREGEDFAHLVDALDGVLRRLGGTARCWRTDRMATIVEPGSDRLRAGGGRAGQALRRHGRGLPAAAGAAQGRRRGARSATCSARGGAPRRSRRRRRRRPIARPLVRRRSPTGAAAAGSRSPSSAAAEPLLPLPAVAYPAELPGGAGRLARARWSRSRATATASRPSLAGQTVTVRARLGEPTLRVVSAAGVARRDAPARCPPAPARSCAAGAHQAALEQAVLAAFTTGRPCARKPNRPPSDAGARARGGARPATRRRAGAADARDATRARRAAR